MILAMDAGVSAANATGAALFHSTTRRLQAVTLVRRNKTLDGLAAHRDIAQKVVLWCKELDVENAWGRLDAFVTEWPQIYPGETKKDPNDLLPLCGLIGAVNAMLPPWTVRHTFLPREWGAIGDATEGRVREHLAPDERKLLDAVMPPSLRHNAADSVGIGLHFLGRFGRRRAVHCGP